MNGDRSADFFTIVSRSAANEVFRDTLRLFVGRGRRYSVKQLSIGTGIKGRMIESFMAPVDSVEYRKPDLEEVLSLMKFLGAEFASELLAIADLGAFETPAMDDPDPGRIAVEAVQDAAELNSMAASDTVVGLREVGTRMMVRGASLRAVAMKDQPTLFDQRRRVA